MRLAMLDLVDRLTVSSFFVFVCATVDIVQPKKTNEETNRTRIFDLILVHTRIIIEP